ncbi:MAG TPA: MBL fold metallo-hydrolase [Longimicrobiales bacterium]|nr:MBL fold metallo-hydrolase [Longimicrobiales bacterium]
MKVAVLGSGSSGNATLVRAGNTHVLVDAGFSGRDLERRLTTLGVEPGEIRAIVISHDHGDHTRGMGVFARKHATPLYMTDATRDACSKLLRGEEEVRPYRPGRPFVVGDVRVEPFITIHDAADPVGLAVVDECTGLRMGVATDLGRPTAQIRHALSRCDLLVLEANHDEVLLATGPYPWSVKRRIASSHGHLSNQAAAQFVLELLHPRLAGVVLAHLSNECNRPDLALKVVGTALKKAGWTGHLEVARQSEPTAWLDVEELRYRTGPSQLSLL